VLLAWFAAADASLTPFWLTNCGDYNWDINYDCDVKPWGTHIWQVGLGVQVSDHYHDIAQAFSTAHPGATPESVGNEVLRLAGQTLTFPSGTTVAALAASPGSVTQGRHNSYWLATLMRDLPVSAYLEAPAATRWPCYLASAPTWCSYYRQTANWQAYSNVLSQVIVSWGRILDRWAHAQVPDVIVDDMSPGILISGSPTVSIKGGWRGHFYSAPSASSGITGTWSAALPTPGDWAVSAFVPYATGGAAGARMVIHASNGDFPVTLDESATGGRFVELGTYRFGTAATVTLASGAAAGVRWDALRFHLVMPSGATDGGGVVPEAVVPDAGFDDGASEKGEFDAGVGPTEPGQESFNPSEGDSPPDEVVGCSATGSALPAGALGALALLGLARARRKRLHACEGCWLLDGALPSAVVSNQARTRTR